MTEPGMIEPGRAAPADEKRLVEISAVLAAAIVEHLPTWVHRSVAEVATHAGQLSRQLEMAAIAAGNAAVDDIGQKVVELLALDIDEQTTTPLSLVRNAVPYPTQALREAGVPPLDRADFDIAAFPDDLYALTPANFAEVHPDLHVPGLEWGAAKAFVHLRRREAEGRV